MIAKLSLNDIDELMAQLENGNQIIAATSEEMIEKLIDAGVTFDDLWFDTSDKALMIGQMIAIRYALRCKANADELLLSKPKSTL